MGYDNHEIIKGNVEVLEDGIMHFCIRAARCTFTKQGHYCFVLKLATLFPKVYLATMDHGVPRTIGRERLAMLDH
jgi:hypothetical protein